MKAVKKWWTALDWDDVFSYQTEKKVIIKDRVLGILQLFLNLGILLYVILYVIVDGYGYLVYEVPIGVMYTSLQKPPKLLINSTALPYCTQYIGSNPLPIGSQLPCAMYDEFDVNYPPDETNQLFATLRLTTTMQQSNCPQSPLDCTILWLTNSSTSNYVANVELFTVLVKHSFEARNFYQQTNNPIYARSNDQMTGSVFDHKGNLVMNLPSGSYDIFSIEFLLASAGLSLDNVLNDDRFVNKTFRHSGVVIILTLAYENTDPKNPTYSYKVSPAPETDYKLSQVVSVGSMRKKIDRNGIKIIFIQTGSIGKFDLFACLENLVTSLGLLAVASLVVDALMVQVMPMRKWYASFKFFETEELNLIKHDIQHSDMDYKIYSDHDYASSVKNDQEKLRTSSDNFGISTGFESAWECCSFEFKRREPMYNRVS